VRPLSRVDVFLCPIPRVDPYPSFGAGFRLKVMDSNAGAVRNSYLHEPAVRSMFNAKANPGNLDQHVRALVSAWGNILQATIYLATFCTRSRGQLNPPQRRGGRAIRKRAAW
jgi:hypothetical protein